MKAFFSLFIITSLSQSLTIVNDESNNIEFEIPSGDVPTIIFRGTGILNKTIAKEAQNKKKIIIEEGITEIENKAFYQSPLKLKDEEFIYEEIELPRSLKRIGDLAFKTQGHELIRVRFPDYNEGNSYDNINESELEKFYSLREIGDYAFSGQKLTEHNIPPTFTLLGKNSFEFCLFQSIKLNSKIQTIENYAFHFCQNLKEITLPSLVTRVSISSFENCRSLQSVSWLSEKVELFGYNAFYGCSSLEDFIFPKVGSGFYSCGYFFQNCYSLKRCIFPKQIKDGNIGRGTFLNCKNLKEVYLPENIHQIPQDFFRNSSIEYAYLPINVNIIGFNAFRDCQKLKFVHFQHQGTITIDTNVFIGSNNIEVAVIEGNITRIDEHLMEVKTFCYMGIENPTIEEGSFDSSKTNLYLTKRFEETNPNVKFGNNTNFEGYSYHIQQSGTCNLPKIYTEFDDNNKKDKTISTLTIVLIVVCILAFLSIVAMIIVIIYVKKRRNGQEIEDQNSISENI